MSRVARTATATLAALLLVAGVLLLSAGRADSQPPLPPIAAADLLVSVRAAAEEPPPVSGEVAATLSLGLPEVEFEGAEEEFGAASELAGDKRLRVWRSDDGLRVAELRDSSERALITDGETVWTWDSTDLTVTQTPLPEGLGHDRPLPEQAADPLEVARQALAAVDGSTDVTVERTSVVAGRDAYRLVLTPRTDDTLVGRVELDVDAEERVPLRAAVYARGATEPALEAGYQAVSFAPIDPATFTFVPPPGATVTEEPLPEPPTGAEREAFGQRYAEEFAGAEQAGEGAPEPQVLGEGWTSVVAVPTDGAIGAAADGAEDDAAAQQLTGLLPFSGPLFSARTATVDGQEYLLFGAVPQEGLQAAATGL